MKVVVDVVDLWGRKVLLNSMNFFNLSGSFGIEVRGSRILEEKTPHAFRFIPRHLRVSTNSVLTIYSSLQYNTI